MMSSTLTLLVRSRDVTFRSVDPLALNPSVLATIARRSFSEWAPELMKSTKDWPSGSLVAALGKIARQKNSLLPCAFLFFLLGKPAQDLGEELATLRLGALTNQLRVGAQVSDADLKRNFPFPEKLPAAGLLTLLDLYLEAFQPIDPQLAWQARDLAFQLTARGTDSPITREELREMVAALAVPDTAAVSISSSIASVIRPPPPPPPPPPTVILESTSTSSAVGSPHDTGAAEIIRLDTPLMPDSPPMTESRMPERTIEPPKFPPRPDAPVPQIFSIGGVGPYGLAKSENQLLANGPLLQIVNSSTNMQQRTYPAIRVPRWCPSYEEVRGKEKSMIWLPLNSTCKLQESKVGSKYKENLECKHKFEETLVPASFFHWATATLVSRWRSEVFPPKKKKRQSQIEKGASFCALCKVSPCESYVDMTPNEIVRDYEGWEHSSDENGLASKIRAAPLMPPGTIRICDSCFHYNRAYVHDDLRAGNGLVWRQTLQLIWRLCNLDIYAPDMKTIKQQEGKIRSPFNNQRIGPSLKGRPVLCPLSQITGLPWFRCDGHSKAAQAIVDVINAQETPGKRDDILAKVCHRCLYRKGAFECRPPVTEPEECLLVAAFCARCLKHHADDIVPVMKYYQYTPPPGWESTFQSPRVSGEPTATTTTTTEQSPESEYVLWSVSEI
jgi:hypothetical protein